MSQKLPAIVLVNPQMGENIGAAARAMLNCGLEDLRIVNPRDGWPSESAVAMSSGALGKMPPVGVFDSVSDAIADCHYVYATTARPRDMQKPVFTAHGAAVDIHKRMGQKTAIVFGCERSGLSNYDVSLANAIVTVPLNPEFSSLNLAQSVLLVSYEYMQNSGEVDCKVMPPPAPQADFDNLCKRLEDELDKGGFFKSPEMRPTIVRNLRNMLARAEMSEQEVRTFHGIISALTRKKLEQGRE